MNHIRLRHVALVVQDLNKTVEQVQQALRLPSPFNDDLANQFDTDNAVFTLGNSFLEICSPYADGPVRSYAQERGGDVGYMAVFQVPDSEHARSRLDTLGVRVVAELKLFDQGANMLHPKDLPGAMVSFDWAKPYESWRWGGPAWSGQVPEHVDGGIHGLTVRMQDPLDAAQKWARALETEAVLQDDGSACVRLADVGQTVRFIPTEHKLDEGICGVDLRLPADVVNTPDFEIANVRFVVTNPDEEH